MSRSTSNLRRRKLAHKHRAFDIRFVPCLSLGCESVDYGVGGDGDDGLEGGDVASYDCVVDFFARACWGGVVVEGFGVVVGSWDGCWLGVG